MTAIKPRDLFTMRWKVVPCHVGESCWCRLVVPEDPCQFEDESDAYVIPDGAIDKETAEHIVTVHNEALNTWGVTQ